MNLNQNIALYRKHCGYTQEQLAERLGVSAQSVSKWENGVSNPDISLLPDLATALGVDINALFAEQPAVPQGFAITDLPNLCYEAASDLFCDAHHRFFGAKGTVTQDEYRRRGEVYRQKLAGPPSLCGYMFAEGDAAHGAVLLSDAITCIDRSYGSKDSTLLFDLDKAGELLSVLGKPNNRRVLKLIYERQIRGGEGETDLTPEEAASETGLTVSEINEAVVELRHVALLDEHERIENSTYTKKFCTLYAQDYVIPVSILRLAYIHASHMTMSALMYFDAVGGGSFIKETL